MTRGPFASRMLDTFTLLQGSRLGFALCRIRRRYFFHTIWNQRAERAYSRVDSLTPSVHETIERVASKAASALDRAQSEASDAQATAYAKFDDLINGEWAESVREEVRARPLAVVGIALLAGLVIGRLI